MPIKGIQDNSRADVSKILLCTFVKELREPLEKIDMSFECYRRDFLMLMMSKSSIK